MTTQAVVCGYYAQEIPITLIKRGPKKEACREEGTRRELGVVNVAIFLAPACLQTEG